MLRHHETLALDLFSSRNSEVMRSGRTD